MSPKIAPYTHHSKNEFSFCGAGFLPSVLRDHVLTVWASKKLHQRHQVLLFVIGLQRVIIRLS